MSRPMSPQAWGYSPGSWFQEHFPAFTVSAVKRQSGVLEELQKLSNEKLEQPQWRILRLASSRWADVGMWFIILCHCIVLGFDVQGQFGPSPLPSSQHILLMVLQVMFVILYIVEYAALLRLHGWWHIHPIHKPAAFVDLVIALACYADLGVAFAGLEVWRPASLVPLRLCRFLRWSWMLEGLGLQKELYLFEQGLLPALMAAFWTSLLVFVLMYVGSLLSVALMRQVSPMPDFNSVSAALYFHFELATGKEWTELEGSSILRWWSVYFRIFTVVVSFGVLHLATGLVCEHFRSLERWRKARSSKPSTAECSSRLTEQLQGIIQEGLGLGDDWLLTLEDFAALLDTAAMQELIEGLEVCTDLPCKLLFELLDERGEGITADQLAKALLRLRGTRKQPHALLMRRDVARCEARELGLISELEATLSQQTKSQLQSLEESIQKQLESMADGIVAGALQCSGKCSSTPPTSSEGEGTAYVPYSVEGLQRVELVLDQLLLEIEELTGGPAEPDLIAEASAAEPLEQETAVPPELGGQVPPAVAPSAEKASEASEATTREPTQEERARGHAEGRESPGVPDGTQTPSLEAMPVVVELVVPSEPLEPTVEASLVAPDSVSAVLEPGGGEAEPQAEANGLPPDFSADYDVEQEAPDLDHAGLASESGAELGEAVVDLPPKPEESTKPVADNRAPSEPEPAPAVQSLGVGVDAPKEKSRAVDRGAGLGFFLGWVRPWRVRISEDVQVQEVETTAAAANGASSKAAEFEGVTAPEVDEAETLRELSTGAASSLLLFDAIGADVAGPCGTGRPLGAESRILGPFEAAEAPAPSSDDLHTPLHGGEQELQEQWPRKSPAFRHARSMCL